MAEDEERKLSTRAGDLAPLDWQTRVDGPEREKVRELVARRSLRLAFHINPLMALEELEEAEKADLISVDASTLTSDLQAEAIVRIYVAKALQLIAVEPYLKSRATEIEESEKSHVDESLPLDVVLSEVEYERISDLVTGDQQSLWEAFVTNPPLALDLIGKDAKAGFRQEAETKLTSLLEKQARAQLFMALKLARIADETHQKTIAVKILLDEAAQLPDLETVCPALRSLKSVEPRAVIPSLIAFLRKADDKPVLDAGLETLEHLLHGGFAAQASESPAAPSSEGSSDLVESPGVLIHLPLTIPPGLQENPSVARMDASQQISPGSTTAPSPDLDLAATEFGGSAALAQGVQTIAQHAADPARIAGPKAFVTFLSSNIEPVVEVFRQPLLRYSREWPDFIPALVRILDRLRAKLVAMSPVLINEPSLAAGAGGDVHGPSVSAGSDERVGSGVTEKSGAATAANQRVGGAATIEEAVELMLSTYYTPIKAAERLNLSDRTVREHCESGAIRAIQVGRDWYISPQAVEEFASNRPRRGPKPKHSSSL